MNTTKQIKALAELDGNYFISDSWSESVGRRRLNEWIATRKPYLTSYNAIIPLIQEQLDGIQSDLLAKYGADLILMPPSQLCEALLRATGKWKE